MLVQLDSIKMNTPKKNIFLAKIIIFICLLIQKFRDVSVIIVTLILPKTSEGRFRVASEGRTKRSLSFVHFIPRPKSLNQNTLGDIAP
jgi:hypothetical protein